MTDKKRRRLVTCKVRHSAFANIGYFWPSNSFRLNQYSRTLWSDRQPVREVQQDDPTFCKPVLPQVVNRMRMASTTATCLSWRCAAQEIRIVSISRFCASASHHHRLHWPLWISKHDLTTCSWTCLDRIEREQPGQS